MYKEYNVSVKYKHSLRTKVLKHSLRTKVLKHSLRTKVLKHSLKPFQGYKNYRIEFAEEKNLLLKETREISFEDVIVAIEEKEILGDLKHGNKKYAHQRILVISRGEYAYAVPYVIDPKRKVIFLKTLYPSRVLTDKYMKGGVKDENGT